MKIFISYSKYDKKIVLQLEKELLKVDHQVYKDDLNIRAGDNLFRKINEGIKGVDAILILVSQYTLTSKYALKEIESIILNDITKKSTHIIPISVDGTILPGYLSNYIFSDFSKDVQGGIYDLVGHLEMLDAKGKKSDEKKVDKNIRGTRNQVHIDSLSKSLKDGRLTLVCGAGVSIGAKIPSWNDLLLRLLESMLIKISNNHSISLKNFNTRDFQKRLGSSALVMGKYLKSNLGNDFLPELRDALYAENPSTCELINSIVELSRPQRDGKPLDSIITFNFDALIEENLDINNIRYKPIDRDGNRNAANELPIYHVHGYLPRKGKINKDSEIVFSEDTYHTQFIEPFSWSNLIQLNKLSQNTCLFIGMSLTDPNLRRLLDVANRKEPMNNQNHYIIKKLPVSNDNDSKTDELMAFLEEQDSNELGLNVIWVNEFEQIPEILNAMK